MNLLQLFKNNKETLALVSLLSIDRIIGFIIIYFLVRNISDEYFAYWTQLNFLPGLLTGIFLLGFSRGILRILTNNKFSQNLVYLTLISLVLILLFIGCFFFSLVNYLDIANINIFLGGNSNTDLGIKIIFLFIIFEGLFEIFGNFLRAKLSNLYLYFLGFKIIPRIFVPILIIFNYSFWVSIYFYLIGNLFITFLSVIFVLKTIKKIHPNKKMDIIELKKLLLKLTRYSFPIFVSSLSFPLLNFLLRDYIISENGYEYLGLFSIYISFIGILVYFPDAIQSYLFPKLAFVKDNTTNQDKSKKYILYKLKFTILISLFFCFIFFLFGSNILYFIYPKNSWNFIDCLFISITSFSWIIYNSLQRIYLIYLPEKTIFITILVLISSILSLIFLYNNLLTEVYNAILSLFIYFFISSFLIKILLKKKKFLIFNF